MNYHGTLQGFEFNTEEQFTILWTVDIDYELTEYRDGSGRPEFEVTYRVGRLLGAWMVGDYKLSGPALELFNHRDFLKAEAFTKRFDWLVQSLNTMLPDKTIVRQIQDEVFNQRN